MFGGNSDVTDFAHKIFLSLFQIVFVPLLGELFLPVFLTLTPVVFFVHIVSDLSDILLRCITLGDKWLQEKYTAKRNLFLKGLDDLNIAHTVPQGAYYVLLDISEFGFDSDLEFCETLARDVGVGAVPGSSFFREPVNHLIRLHFAKKDETLNEALNRLELIRKKIPSRKASL